MLKKCSAIYGDFPIPPENVVATEAFNACLATEIDAYLLTKGLTPDMPCDK